MNNIIIIFISIISISCYGQENIICDLQAENTKWKNIFENTQTKAEKIILIKKKIQSDSIYLDYQPKFNTHQIIYKAVDKYDNDCGCKILFKLNYSKTKSLTLNQSGKPKLNLVLKILDIDNVDKIFSVFDKSAESLYGTYGKCGVVILTTKNRKIKKIIKENGI